MLKTTDRQEPPPSTRIEDRGDPRSFPPLGTAIKVLMIWPHFPPSFWGFAGVMDLIPEETVHPPLGLLTLAALLTQSSLASRQADRQ